jgi:hypothetical protein
MPFGALKAIDERGSNPGVLGSSRPCRRRPSCRLGSVSGNCDGDLGSHGRRRVCRLRRIPSSGNHPRQDQGLRNVPFDTALGISTSAGSGYWVGEGMPKPLTAFNVDKTTLTPLKCANIVVLTRGVADVVSRTAPKRWSVTRCGTRL